ncbi:MAG: radical SAM protein [Candidatus Omnitrophica bacterium]|nr:radical SAM protein [Candidatus Omnitrophota bacterium]
MIFKNALCVYPHQEGIPEKKYCIPIGLEYIATALKGLIEKVTLIDMRFEPNLGDFIKNDDVDLIGLSINWDYQREAAINVISGIPAGIKVIVGGRVATTYAEELFERCPNIDIIVRGDGEEIVRDIASGLSLEEITGISYRKGTKIIHNKIRELCSLSNINYPDRKMRRNPYRLSLKKVDCGIGIDFISTSRGCPYKCKFCTFTNNPLGQKRLWSARSAESVVEELKEIDANFIGVVDDNFAVDMKRVEKICDMIIAESIKKTFMVNARIEIYKHPQILKKMYKAGFKILLIGIESAQNKTLKAMEKGFDVAEAEKALKEIGKVGFYIHGFFIIGCIDEDESDMLEIATFAKRLKLDSINLSILRTEKYSPLNDLIANREDYYANSNDLICSKKYPLELLKDIRRSIRRDYYTYSTIFRIAKKIVTSRVVTFRIAARLASIIIVKQVFKKKKKRKK